MSRIGPMNGRSIIIPRPGTGLPNTGPLNIGPHGLSTGPHPVPPWWLRRIRRMPFMSGARIMPYRGN